MKQDLPFSDLRQTSALQNTSVTDVYDGYSPALLAYVLKVIPDIHQAQIILHNVFQRFSFSTEPQRGYTNLFVPLLNMVRNEAIETIINSSPLRINSPGNRAVAITPHMKSFIRTLPLMEKTIMALNFFRGMTIQQTAEFLLLPQNLVQIKMQSALQKLYGLHADRSIIKK